jgi:membrane protease YdiL (CAAX protease family)
MSGLPPTYFAATRHPWPTLAFLFPLLVTYEAGIIWLGGAQPELLRNGADTWLRWGLEAFGLRQLYGAPALILVLFCAWSWRQRLNRPTDLYGICLGMTSESAAFGLGLWGISRSLGPVLDRLGITLSTGPRVELVGQVLTFVGAGIYEEVLFRLGLLSGLVLLFRLAQLPRLLTVPLATVVSALLFAAAHHVGPYGEPYNGYVFLFRTLAGLYFAFLYLLRGFGIAVGAHASYDVLVGVLVPATAGS